MHKVVILATDDVDPFDLAVPYGVFAHARLTNGKPAYDVRVCGARRKIKTGLFDIQVRYGINEALKAHTLIVPGHVHAESRVSSDVLRVLRKAATRKIRIASICSGAFILAEAGILNGLSATTHWMAASILKARFPLVHVNPEVLYVDNGKVLTSAGAAAGLDLCLHMVRHDFGSAVAADTARICVMPLERAGGQSQFIVHTPPSMEGNSLEPVLEWLDRNCHKPLSLDDIARQAGMSKRTLSRKFADQTGTTPLQQLIRSRIRRGQQLLERTGLSIELVAEKIGFGSATSFRTHFGKLVGISPQNYRDSFKSK